ncbi:MAG: LysE family translocator [Alphaproteobacteria bacterium]|nr:LysE family translocator [Alphaproteobacteria bacterium]
MMHAEIWAWTALAALVTITPGPDTLLVAGHAIGRGVRAGLAAGAGIVAGFFWYAALALFGFMALLAASPIVFMIVKIAGALYLAWIGAQMLFGAFRPSTEEEKPAPLGAPFRQGFLSNALNPKVALFYLAALPHFIGTGSEAPLRAALLIGIHYAMSAVWLGAVALVAAGAGRAARTSALYRWINGAIGAALVGIGARLAFERR